MDENGRTRDQWSRLYPHVQETRFAGPRSKRMVEPKLAIRTPARSLLINWEDQHHCRGQLRMAQHHDSPRCVHHRAP